MKLLQCNDISCFMVHYCRQSDIWIWFTDALEHVKEKCAWCYIHSHKCWVAAVCVCVFIKASIAIVKPNVQIQIGRRGLPVIKRLDPVSTRRVKSSTKTFPAGVTTCNHFISEWWNYARKQKANVLLQACYYLNTGKFYMVCFADVIPNRRAVIQRSITDPRQLTWNI